MIAKPTLAARGVLSFVGFAVSRGAGRQQLLDAAGIDASKLLDGDNRIPLHKYVLLVRMGQRLCNDPALALHFGEAIDCSEIAVPVGGATTFADAIESGNRYAPITVDVETVGSAARFALKMDGGQLWMIDHRANANDFPELTESGFARMACSTRRVTAGTSAIKGVHVTHAAPPYRDEYDRIFGVPVTFASDRNALLLDMTVIARFPFPGQPGYVTDVMRDHAEGLLRELDSLQSVRGRVEALLPAALKTGDVRVDVIAKQLGLSRQTLFRKLAAEGVTFQQVLDELRCRLALHYLTTEKSTVQRTAALLAFSDSTAFSRAFKRWTGAAPRELLQRSAPPPSVRHSPLSLSARE